MLAELRKVEIARLRPVEEFRHDPLGFVLWAFPWEEAGTPLATHAGPERWQAEVLAEIGAALAAGSGPVRIAVASGHGVGKSALVAWLMLWSLATEPGTRGVITANTETQLRTKSWTELGKWHRLALTHNWLTLGATSLAFALLAKDKSAGRIDLVPWAAHNPEAFAGLHNQGSRVLLLFDEASAIADSIWETSEGALTDGNTETIWLAFGNPTRTSGRFHDCFGRFRSQWRTRQVDSRSVALTDKAQLGRWIEGYGEGSDFVAVRVRGLFPQAGSLQLIDGQAVDDAMRRLVEPEHHAPLVMGVDVARFGDDRSVVVLRRGLNARVAPVEKHNGMDLMTLAGRVVELAARHHDLRAIFVDETGLGAAEIDASHVGRAEMWGNLRDWLKAGGALPDDPELRADLTGLEYGYSAKGEIQLEKKEDMKRRGLASPDIGDALALTFAQPVAAFWAGQAEKPGRCITEDDDPDWVPWHDA